MTEKRGRGRPKKTAPPVEAQQVPQATPAPPQPKSAPKMPDWDRSGETEFISRLKSKAAKVDWHDYSDEDRLHVPKEIIESLKADGLVLQWVTTSVLGKEDLHRFSIFQRGGWEPVPEGFRGIATTRVEGVQLMVRAAATTRRRKPRKGARQWAASKK